MKLAIPLFLLFLLSFSYAQEAPHETQLLSLGEERNFGFGESTYTVLPVGILKESAVFVASGIRVSPKINETKFLDLNGDGVGDIGVTLNSILPNSTVNLTLTYQVDQPACRNIGSTCAQDEECCVGKCIAGICNYPPTAIETTGEEVEVDVPQNISLGRLVELKITKQDGTPAQDAIIDIITPKGMRLTLLTNETGQVSFIAFQEGVYSYAVYKYLPKENKTTLSFKELPPEEKKEEPKPFCGDGRCDADENCSTCPQDCGACPIVQQPSETPKPKIDPSWPTWLGVMFIAIFILLRFIIPLFIK